MTEKSKGRSLKLQKGESKDMKFDLSAPITLKQIESHEINMDKIKTTSSSDFDQWLHAMKMVARLPGGMPPEFRRKLWLALSEKYLQTKNVNWEKEEEKCFSDKCREDDEELGIQIVKDLHRTGSSLCSGPAGSINQAKLKKILLGYARWNPEVGYCQGFNMLGALILQVMDKNEVESMKVMIYLVEGVLPPGYFSGSLGGLQADMAVFRDLMTAKLPKLAKHLQKLQGPMGEGSFEPPLTNVFTMQWFLTMFCTCLPITCVLRVWDLVLIEGSDVLLRTALAIWTILEERVMSIKSADDFYCKMGTLSGELLNGHLIDSNGLIERVVKLGPIPELQKMRDKHLYNIAPWRDKKGIKLYYSDDEADSDDDSHLAVTTAWGLRVNRRGSGGLPSSSKPIPDNKDRIALDISILKKQYERLRERQRQAHIILTAAVARQAVNPSTPSLQMNQLLMGRSAIVTNKGRRIGPPPGAIPPVRKTPPQTMSRAFTKKSEAGQKSGDIEMGKCRKPGVSKWKDTSFDLENQKQKQSESGNSSMSSGSEKSPSRSRKRSESSSYSEDSDDSSTSTSLCDDDDDNASHDVFSSSLESSPMRRQKTPVTEVPKDDENLSNQEGKDDEEVLKAISYEEYEFCVDSDMIEMDNEIPGDTSTFLQSLPSTIESEVDNELPKSGLAIVVDEDSSTECDRFDKPIFLETNETSSKMENISDFLHTTDPRDDISMKNNSVSASANDFPLVSNFLQCQHQAPASQSPLLGITSTSQLSPIADISKYLSTSSISPLKTPSLLFDYSNLMSSSSTSSTCPAKDEEKHDAKKFHITDEGVTNEYFERVNIVDRPKYLDLTYSLDDEDKCFEKKGFCQKTDFNALSPSLPNQVTEDSLTTPSPIKSVVEESSLQNFSQSDSNSTIFDKSTTQENLQATSSSITKLKPSPSYLTENDKISEISSARTTTLLEYEFDQKSDLFRNRNFIREKSFSFDKPVLSERNQMRPKSCPEVQINVAGSTSIGGNEDGGSSENNRMPSDRVLKIIEENSLILHRILKKTVSDISQIQQNKENCDENTWKSPVTPRTGGKLFLDSLTVDTGNTLAGSTENIFTYDYHKTGEEEFLKTSRLSKSSDELDEKKDTNQTLDSKNISLRTDDNLTDRLESIKNTIKSIDSLCENRDTFRKEKCQRYIDSLFEDSVRETSCSSGSSLSHDEVPKIKSVVAPTIEINEIDHNDRIDNELQDNKIDDNTHFEPSYSTTRYSRDFKREISPRRRKDEDREEYESRLGRDKIPKFYDLSIDRTLNNVNTVSLQKSIREEDTNMNNKGLINDKKYDDDSYHTPTHNITHQLLSPSKDEKYFNNRPSQMYQPAKLELRHTTVTSTFYDRYLSQKLERNAKAMKSSLASSPSDTTKTYFDTLKPTSLMSKETIDRNSKSSENSPSRNQRTPSLIFSSTTAGDTTSSSLSTMSTSSSKGISSYIPNTGLHIRSCDNIVLHLKTTSPHEVTTLSPSSSRTTRAITPTSPTSPVYSPLPIKPRKPSELGIQLGLYKNLSKDLSKS